MKCGKCGPEKSYSDENLCFRAPDHVSMEDHPSHYNIGNYEVIDVIEDWKLNFHLGNAIKYIARADYKDDPKSDLRKAIWYLNREIERRIRESDPKRG